MAQRVALAADHRGYLLKGIIKDFLQGRGEHVLDLGTNSSEPVDYPDYALAVAEAILAGRADCGIILCGSGIGASVAANKIPGIRAGLCHDTFMAHQGREDDDMNVICLGAGVVGPQLAVEIVKTCLDARFSGAERHVRRLNKVAEIERNYLSQTSPGRA